MQSTQLSDKTFWDQEWEQGKENYEEFVSGDLLKKYIPKSLGSFFEIGCAPGGILCYFNKVLGYKVAGIDYSSVDRIGEYLNDNGIHDYQLIEGDFTTYETTERYDVVGSFGFIEHFKNFEEIIERQMALVKDNGYLIVELPNLRYFNWLLYRIFNPQLLAIHNLESMNISRLKKAIRNDYEFLYAGFNKTCFLSFQEDNNELKKRPVLRKVFITMKSIMKKLHLENLPTRFFSPYIVIIAKKK